MDEQKRRGCGCLEEGGWALALALLALVSRLDAGASRKTTMPYQVPPNNA